MRFDTLHEKFIKCWRSQVISNEWQIVPLHFVLLSQLVGTVPSMDLSRPSEPGMRLVLNGKPVHPRLHFFAIQGSRTGKGEGQKVLLGILRYFNMRHFLQKYKFPDSVTDPTLRNFSCSNLDDIPKAMEFFIRYRRETKERFKSDNTIATVDDASEDTSAVSSDEKTADTEKREGYKMSMKEQYRILDEIHRKEGKRWIFFEDNTCLAYPMTVQASTATKESLIGGYDNEPQGTTGIMKKVWKPGMMQTQAIYAWDEARNIVYQKGSEGEQLNSMLCSALDHVGVLRTKSRKDVDEHGNQKSYQSFASVITGTIRIEGLDLSLAQTGFLQRFLISFKDIDAGTAVEMRKSIAKNRTTIGGVDKLLEAYFDDFYAAPVYRGIISFDEGAVEYQTKRIDEEEEKSRQMFGVGTLQHKSLNGFFTAHADYMKKIAAIVAALDNKSVVTKEYIKKVYDMYQEDALESLFALLDECTGNIDVKMEHRNQQCDEIISQTFEKSIPEGKSYLSHSELVDRLRNNPRWPRHGFAATENYVKKWILREISRYRTDIVDNQVRYILRTTTLEYEQEKARAANIEIDALMKDQDMHTVVKGWSSLIQPVVEEASEAKDVKASVKKSDQKPNDGGQGV